jgi:hypothetical protein
LGKKEGREKQRRGGFGVSQGGQEGGERSDSGWWRRGVSEWRACAALLQPHDV